MDEGLFVYLFIIIIPTLQFRSLPPRGKPEGGFILSFSLSASPWHEAVACACAP